MQLQSRIQRFTEAGIGVVAITYDAPALQRAFVGRNAITYPILSDIGAVTMKRLDVLDPSYPPGDDNYGVPYPGVFIVDLQHRIVGKVFLKGFQKRVDADGVLAFAQEVLH